MSISVAILTYNEEKNIAATIKSVYDWVDEVIVVDGTSTDNTVSVIKELDKQKKTKIFIEDNPPNFLVNKQKAIERCTKEWILQLDADEIVSDNLRSEILSLKSDNIVAYWIPRLNYFLGRPLRKGGVYPDYVLRLYKNGVARIPLKGIHDQVEIDIEKVYQVDRLNRESKSVISKTDHRSPVTIADQPIIRSTSIDYLKNPLLHYSYPSFKVYLRKWKQYCEYEALDLHSKGIKPNLPMTINYLIFKPTYWFFLTYFRHKGFMDGIPGLVFSFFSSIRYWLIYKNLTTSNEPIIIKK